MQPEITQEFDLPKPYNLWHSVRFQRMGKLDPRVLLDREHYAFASNLPSGPCSALVEVENTKLRCRLWGPGSSALLEQIPAQLGLTMPLLAEGIETLPKSLRLIRPRAYVERPSCERVTDLVPTVLQHDREAANHGARFFRRTVTCSWPPKLRLPTTSHH